MSWARSSGSPGSGVYLAAVELGVNRFVLPAPPLGHWWTIPALVLNAIEAGLVEEVIVLGYLDHEAAAAVVAGGLGGGGERAPPRLVPPVSGLGRVPREPRDGGGLRSLFLRWGRRTWPFVFAHVLLDIGAGVGFILFRDRLPGF